MSDLVGAARGMSAALASSAPVNKSQSVSSQRFFTVDNGLT